MIRMASVEQAIALLTEYGAARPEAAVPRPLCEAANAVLAEPVTAQMSSPPADVSAMDGYAVVFADMAGAAPLRVIGESRAGEPYSGVLSSGEAVRIFTGAHLPPGADHVLIQEEARREGDAMTPAVTPIAAQDRPGNIRRLGRDFRAGAVLIPAGARLSPGAMALAAAGNVGEVKVRASVRIGVLANGDELREAGSELAPGQVVNSIAPALLALLETWGCAPINLGVARDDKADVAARIAGAAATCDVILSIGGASVGDYDVVRDAFAAEGYVGVFEKVAVKPGKPTWFSAKPNGPLVLGLPGNPAAAMVTSRLFLRPLLSAITGETPLSPPATMRAATTKPLPPGGGREDYLRAVMTIDSDGRPWVAPAEDQDSSLLSPFLTANALIRRPIRCPAAEPGDAVEFVWL